jgi:hypothetical protein
LPSRFSLSVIPRLVGAIGAGLLDPATLCKYVWHSEQDR